MKEHLLPVLILLQSLAPLAVILGAAIVLAALIWWIYKERQQSLASAFNLPHPHPRQPIPWFWLAALGIIVAIGAVLRLQGLDAKTITHPEVYIPGIPLPDGISIPSPRLSLWRVITWHFFVEPHPLGYYVAMFGWTTIFGTSLASLRMPAALLGILSLPILYRIGALVYSRTVGLIAAGLLTLHGLHVYWSQQARMYVPECFFGLLATWLLLEILRASRPRRLLEGAYVASMLAGFSTEWFFWPLAGAHVLFTILHYGQQTRRMRRLLHFQVLSMILGAYTLSHALTTLWQAGSGGDPSLEALRDFFIFGLFYEPDLRSATPRLFPVWVLVLALVLSVTLVLRGLSVLPVKYNEQRSWPVPAKGPLILAAAGMTILMAGLALPSLPGIKSLVGITFFPLITLFAFPIAAAGSRFRPLLESPGRKRVWLAAMSSLIVLLAFAPLLLIFVVSEAWRPMMVRRALLVFVPYLLLVAAAGAREIGRRRIVAWPLAAVLGTLFAASAWHFRTMPTQRDYAGIAHAVKQRLEPGDVIFVPARQWWATPLFYYLDPSLIVARDFDAFVERRPDARVWVVLLPESEPRDMLSALRGFKIRETVEALGARAVLFSRQPNPSDRQPRLLKTSRGTEAP